MASNDKQPLGSAAYPPSMMGMGGGAGGGMGMMAGGFPQTGFAQPGGYGVPPPAAGFIYPPSAGPSVGGPHSAYGMPGDDNHHKPYSNESASSYGDLNGFDFSERTIRMAFIRKVYALLSLQLMLTTGIIALFSLHDDTRLWVRKNPAFCLASYVIAIILLFAMACFENLRRKSPHNLILLGLFTLTYGVVVGVIASQYNIQEVAIAGGVTVAVCIGLTIFSFQTKYDFTMMGGALFVCLLVMMIFGFIAVFLGPTFRLVLACAGVLLFSVYLVYDTQLMIGGTHKMAISPEEYIFAALNIYMDVIMIFLYLLRIFGSRD